MRPFSTVLSLCFVRMYYHQLSATRIYSMQVRVFLMYELDPNRRSTSGLSMLIPMGTKANVSQSDATTLSTSVARG